MRGCMFSAAAATGCNGNDKYAVVSGQNASIQLIARPLSGTQVALTWQQNGASSISTYTVERALNTNGPFTAIGQVSGAFRFLDESVSPQTAYAYRVRNIYNTDLNPYSNVAQAQTPSSATKFPVADMAIWLRAEDLAVADGASVASWPDAWQPSQAAVQSNPTDQPSFAIFGINGRPAVKFAGGKYFQLPSVLTNAAAAEIYAVLVSVTNSPAANQGLWTFNTNGPTYYPTTGGGIQDAFGSTNSKALIGPLPDLRIASIYNVAAATNLWRGRLNGPVKQELTTNTVRFVSTPLLGRSTLGASEPFAGNIAEILVFNRVLTLDEQKTVRDGLE